MIYTDCFCLLASDLVSKLKFSNFIKKTTLQCQDQKGLKSSMFTSVLLIHARAHFIYSYKVFLMIYHQKKHSNNTKSMPEYYR